MAGSRHAGTLAEAVGDVDAIGDGREDCDGEGEASSPAVEPEHETTSSAIQSASPRPMHGKRRETCSVTGSPSQGISLTVLLSAGSKRAAKRATVSNSEIGKE